MPRGVSLGIADGKHPGFRLAWGTEIAKRRALILVAVVTPTTDKTNELLRTGLTRAYFATLRSITGEFRASTRPSGVTH
jgi:hypothetical protein